MRYPITLCKLPRLFWWIILIVASLLIPITAYIVADVLNLRTAQVCSAHALLTWIYPCALPARPPLPNILIESVYRLLMGAIAHL